MSYSRRDFIRTSSVASASVLTANYLSAHPEGEKGLTKATNNDNPEVIGHANFKYKVHRDWGNLDPKNSPL